MGNFWVGLLIAVAVVVVVALGSMGWLFMSISRERVTAVTTLNPAGTTGTALLVFHPGLSDFPDRIMDAFADGLVQSGWKVDRTTASKEAPVGMAGYDLLILGSPLYGGIAKPLSDYIARLGDLGGKPVAIVLTGAGETAPSLDATEAMVRAANGVVAGRFAYTTMRPNESTKPYSGSNSEIAVQMARDAGQALVLAPR